MIRDLADGEVVPGEGAYRCSMAHYHGQAICPGPSVSSTGIRKAVTQSPHAFWKTSNINPDRYPEKPENDSLVLGKASHALILGDEVFEDHFIFLPEDAPPRPTKAQVAAYERDGHWSESAHPRAMFWEEWDAKAAGRQFLTDEQMVKITYMAENLAACPEAVIALTGKLTEISMIWQDEKTGLWIKSRPDCIPDDRYDMGDLKCFAPKSRDLIHAALRAVTDWDYAMQLALAQEGAERVFGVTPSQGCMLVFIQSTEPYEPVPVEIDPEALAFARIRNRKGIDMIAHGLKTGEWPFRATTIARYNYPPRMIEEFYAQGEAA